MKAIKAVREERGGLVSSFATGKWKKEYKVGEPTKPDIGYLFAFGPKSRPQAVDECAHCQLWLAEAEVVGREVQEEIFIHSDWREFWQSYKPHSSYAAEAYLLCSSITLLSRL